MELIIAGSKKIGSINIQPFHTPISKAGIADIATLYRLSSLVLIYPSFMKLSIEEISKQL